MLKVVNIMVFEEDWEEEDFDELEEEDWEEDEDLDLEEDEW